MDVDETIAFGQNEEPTPVEQSDATRGDDFTVNAPSFAEIDDDSIGFEHAADSLQMFEAKNLPRMFGDYRLDEIVGEGGAGVVFKATPISSIDSDSVEHVAVKVIRPGIMSNNRAVQRFEKEARTLASINCPQVTRFIHFGKEAGMFYIACEFVEGDSLLELVEQTKVLPSKVSLRIVADLLKAAREIHKAGAIHRDIKPSNVLVAFEKQTPAGNQKLPIDNFTAAKLTDFGLARHLDQSESMEMTRHQSMMGTPLYMAPEQFTDSRTVDARADIYSIGATLYQLIAGTPPFESEDALTLAEMHRNEIPKPLNMIRTDIGDAINHVVLKALEKSPDMRYQHATEMLDEVERILEDRPTSMHTYPQTPESSDSGVKHYVFEWTLDVTAKQLWPLVADTDRFNRALGLPAPEFEHDHSGTDKKTFANVKFNGMKIRWREHPFQWNAGRELGVLREFDGGPFEWVTSTVELHPLAGNKTRLVHKFQVKPRGLFGKLFTPFQFGVMTRPGLNRAYARIEQIAKDKSCGYACDLGFGKTPTLTRRQTKLLEERSKILGQRIENSARAKLFGDYLKTVADSFVAKIRPIELASRLGCSIEESLELCFHATEAAIVSLNWDIICPVCRVAAGNVSTLEKVDDHANCEACNESFQIDFTKSVEAIFCISPEIRNVDQKMFCIGGPFHAPHVLSQNHLRPDQQVDFQADVISGTYDVTAPQFERNPVLKVSEQATQTRAQFLFGADASDHRPTVGQGTVCVCIGNDSDREILVRLEQPSGIGNAFSAAAAFEHPLFSKLMPEKLLYPDQLVGQSNAYLLTIRIIDADDLADELGEARFREAWTAIQKHVTETAKTVCPPEYTGETMSVPFAEFDDLLVTLSDLANRFPPTSNALLDSSCFLVSSGQIMSGSQLNQPAMFGKPIRLARALVGTLKVSELVVEDKLWKRELATQDLLSNFTLQDDTLSYKDKSFVRLVLNRS